MNAWQWDPTLYTGSADHYLKGRFPYPRALRDALADALGLDGTGRLLDVGCGPGTLTGLLAGDFAEAVGVDADPDMVAAATARAAPNTRYRHLRAEELPADLGTFRLVTLAQSFHWMDRPLVAAAVRAMLAPGGTCAHVHASTHQGVETDDLPHPRPPHAAITDLVRAYLGPVRRAGRGQLAQGTASDEEPIYRAAGFTGPERVEVPGRLITRTADETVALVFSLSSSTPHLFGERRADFEADLRALLRTSSPGGTFSELTSNIAVDLWGARTTRP
ncbi:class I SAM-dependent methyltransferase [Actinokineospora auranticolor]|uniref:Methyltransferase family protein n=1 Tax=Actinokineospora auranticolor TaxID=155976 RepID=A0A2S6GG16_9PSEU|nr:class I SAM-dependent methyltransferase [Actinokineospora auranticolor]PPK64167.1 methyltransferase family protein [Actinokineospora auranticolor]